MVHDATFAQEAIDHAVRRLYERMWSFCAGWNRVPFRAAQLNYIIRKFRLLVGVSSLGDVDGISMRVNGHRYAILNRRLCPAAGRRTLEPDVWPVISRDLSPRARFVLLHEFTHLLLHGEERDLWLLSPLDRNGALCWAAPQMFRAGTAFPSDVATPHALREAEADLVALVGLVPDSLLLLWAMEGYLEVDRVAEYLVPEGASVRAADVESLASYRLDVFRKFARIFLRVSQHPIDLPGESFRNVASVDADLEPALCAVAEGKARPVVGDLVLSHPSVRGSSVLSEAIRHGVCVPFAGVIG